MKIILSLFLISNFILILCSSITLGKTKEKKYIRSNRKFKRFQKRAVIIPKNVKKYTFGLGGMYSYYMQNERSIQLDSENYQIESLTGSSFYPTFFFEKRHNSFYTMKFSYLLRKSFMKGNSYSLNSSFAQNKIELYQEFNEFEFQIKKKFSKNKNWWHGYSLSIAQCYKVIYRLDGINQDVYKEDFPIFVIPKIHFIYDIKKISSFTVSFEIIGGIIINTSPFIINLNSLISTSYIF